MFNIVLYAEDAGLFPDVKSSKLIAAKY